MPIATTGYNNDFARFVNFALEQSKTSVSANKSAAVARMPGAGGSAVDGASTLTGRTICAATTDKVGVFSRNIDEQKANNATRTAFLKSVADMFGGAERIPPSVKSALKLGDYDRGKPLTARRIIAVKVAVDAEKASWAEKSKPINPDYVSTYMDTEVLAGKSLTPSEQEMINNAVPLLLVGKPELAGAKDSVAMALKELTTEGTPANRLMKYGGCFTQSGSNFKEGLELLEQFNDWFGNVMSEINAADDDNLSHSECMTTTARCLAGSAQNIGCKNFLEKMVFEDLAINPGRIKPTNEETFGMQHNPVMRFFASGLSNSQNGTLLHMNPAQRAVICDALDVLLPRLDDFTSGPVAQPKHPERIVSRILLKFDAVLALHSSGQLTAASLEKALYSGIDLGEGKTPLERMNNFYDGEENLFEQAFVDEQSTDPEVKNKAIMLKIAYLRSESTGLTIDEDVNMMSQGEEPAILPAYVPYSASMANLDGTDRNAVEQLAADICRPEPIEDYKNDKLYVTRFSVKFGTGEETTFPSTVDEGERNRHAGGIRENVRAMTNGRSAQTASVLFMMTQSGLYSLRHGFPALGIKTTEHTGVKMHLTRNDDTGDITIAYHSVDNSPLNYHWTATVNPSGSLSMTPVVVDGRNNA